jgi:hypothetical protein
MREKCAAVGGGVCLCVCACVWGGWGGGGDGAHGDAGVDVPRSGPGCRARQGALPGVLSFPQP